MAEYNAAKQAEVLRRALAKTDAPIGEHWGVFITTESCKVIADQLEKLQAYEDTGLTPEQIKGLAAGDQYEQLVQMLLDTVPQLVLAIVERLPQLIEAAINDAVEELREG